MDLKLRAAREGRSVSSVIREVLTANPFIKKEAGMQLVDTMRRLAEKIAQENKGVNFTKGLIAMRYEQ